MDDCIRKEVWKYLFGYMPFSASTEERAKIRNDKLYVEHTCMHTPIHTSAQSTHYALFLVFFFF